MYRSPSIIFVNAYASPAFVREWCLKKHSSWNFIFLSDDYTQLLLWKKSLTPNFSFKSLSSEIEESSEKLRGSYMSWIADLGHKNPGPAWWASRVSEKNTMVSCLFDNLCKLRVAKNYLDSTESETLVIVGDFSLLSQLKTINSLLARTISLPFYVSIPRKITKEFLKSIQVFAVISIPVLFLYRSIQLFWHVIQARLAGESNLETSSGKSILIHTYLEEANLLDSFEFKDPYFPGLSDFYKSKGYEVVVLPVMFNIRRTYYSAWNWAKKSKTMFLNPYVLYKFSDYLFAYKVAFRSLKLPQGSLYFNGDDVRRLIKGEISRFAFDCLPNILYLQLPMRMALRGFRFKALVAEFENMIPEKMLVLGFRNHQSDTFLIGFQHGALYPNFLCNFTPIEERSIAPTYDRIVCNGDFFRKILISEGLDPSLPIVGAALRYRHILDSSNSVVDISSRLNKIYDVFVPLPLMLSAGAELLCKVLEAFENSTEKINVLLKPHPMSNMKVLLKSIGLFSLPKNFQLTNAPLSEIFPKSKVVISLSTCSMFEAAAAGVPIVRVRRESALNLDPLGFFRELSPPVSNAGEILEEVRRLINQGEGDRAELLSIYFKILRGAFHPSNELGLAAFLPD